MHLARRLLTALAVTTTAATMAGAAPIALLDRNGASVAVEAYGPNVVHVVIAIDRKETDRGPGYGILPQNTEDKAFVHTAGAAGDKFSSTALL